jgi:hypothetical protein
MGVIAAQPFSGWHQDHTPLHQDGVNRAGSRHVRPLPGGPHHYSCTREPSSMTQLLGSWKKSAALPALRIIAANR